MRKVAALFVAVLVLVPVTARADFDGGMAAYKNGDYDLAFMEFLAEAKGGLPAAQHNVAAMFLRGESVERNYLKAYAWFALAARNGDADSSTALEVVRFKLTGNQISTGERMASKLASENSLSYVSHIPR